MIAAESKDTALKTCVLVEDQTMFLDLIRRMLEPVPGLRIAAQEVTVDGGKNACERHRPDILIIDLALPDGSGLDVARLAIAVNPMVKVIALSGHISDFVCPAWLNDNLHAAISKNDAFTRVREDLDELLAGV